MKAIMMTMNLEKMKKKDKIMTNKKKKKIKRKIIKNSVSKKFQKKQFHHHLQFSKHPIQLNSLIQRCNHLF